MSTAQRMREVKFRGRLITVAVLDGHWEVVEHPDAVAVMVVRGRELLGVRQPRPAVGASTWEIPAGLIEDGEAPEDAARRELAEEVQLGGRLKLVSRLYASPGFTDEQCYLYELSGAHQAAGTPDAGEDLVLEWRDALEVWNGVLAGTESTSGVTLLAVRHVLARSGVTL
ncbi:MAG: NUDIX hydrolase [Truepera sp.]|nr:NUDIX hydrolase [Truepera sp.]